MAVQPTPYVETALAHSAELFRRELQAGLPIGSAGGVVPATPATSANPGSMLAACSDLAVTAPGGMAVSVNPGAAYVCGSLGSGAGWAMPTGYGYPVITTNGGSAPTVGATAQATKIQLTTQGAYYAYVDDNGGPVELTIAQADPSNPRIDVIGAQIEDSSYSGSENAFTLTVVTGTPAASPTVPTFPDSFLPLALVWVPTNAVAIATADILDVRVAYNRNPYTARGYLATNTAGTANNYAKMPITDISYDPTGSISGGFINVPISGVYAITGATGCSASPATAGEIQTVLYANGTQTTYGAVDYFAAAQTSFPASSAADIERLLEGWTVGLYAWFGTTAGTCWGASQRTYLSITLLTPF